MSFDVMGGQNGCERLPSMLSVHLNDTTMRKNNSLFHLSLLLMLALVTGLAGCSDPKSANKKNFTAAIDKAIGDSIFISFDEMSIAEFNGGHGGRRLGKIEQRFENGDHYLKIRRQLFTDEKRELLVEDLVRQGVIIPWMNAYYTGQGVIDFPSDVYLFKAGKVHFAKPVKTDGNAGYAFFCGKPGVDSIIGWTAPAESNGIRMTSVKYTAKLFGVPEWASRIKDYYNNRLRSEKETILVLTDKGWSPR